MQTGRRAFISSLVGAGGLGGNKVEPENTTPLTPTNIVVHINAMDSASLARAEDVIADRIVRSINKSSRGR